MSIAYSVYLIGPSAIVGSVVILCFYPITVSNEIDITFPNIILLQGSISSLSSFLRLKVVTISDKRVTMMSEIINSMRLIKMYAWEQPFTQRIDNLRKDEVKT